MRGTLDEISEHVHVHRIIPAYAGNTYGGLQYAHDLRDHPRVCGEHVRVEDTWCFRTGSSPRMRGTRHCRPLRRRGTRIIPAYAGNTSTCSTPTCLTRDHPRVCGEHRVFIFGEIIKLGSSPRMRGTPRTARRNRRQAGIIPAYAGNTQPAKGDVLRHIGSSPRMRGTRTMA